MQDTNKCGTSCCHKYNPSLFNKVESFNTENEVLLLEPDDGKGDAERCDHQAYDEIVNSTRTKLN